jgi:hypothetical protein
MNPSLVKGPIPCSERFFGLHIARSELQFWDVHILNLQEKGCLMTMRRSGMPRVRVTRDEFLTDRQGKTFADVASDPAQPFNLVLEFFSDADRQHRMEEAELHHDRAPLAGVVRELESQPAIDQFLAGAQVSRNTRFRHAIGVLVRMIMERRGWNKTGRKGSLGVRAAEIPGTPAHNTGGLAFWFCRAERYARSDGMPYQAVRERCRVFDSATSQTSSRSEKTPTKNRALSRRDT